MFSVLVMFGVEWVSMGVSGWFIFRVNVFSVCVLCRSVVMVILDVELVIVIVWCSVVDGICAVLVIVLSSRFFCVFCCSLLVISLVSSCYLDVVVCVSSLCSSLCCVVVELVLVKSWVFWSGRV